MCRAIFSVSAKSIERVPSSRRARHAPQLLQRRPQIAFGGRHADARVGVLAAAREHVQLRIVSGFRTMAHQQALYRAYRRGRGNLAARPGYSNHQSGHALDLNTSARGVYSYLAKHGGAYRFKRTVPSERWHWERW